MELYEIVKYKEDKHTQPLCVFNEQVLTVVTDKALAKRMLEVYQNIQNDDWCYKIITVCDSGRKPFDSAPTSCVYCKSYDKCVNVIKTRPNEMMRCMCFGELRNYIKSKTKEL